MEQNDDEKASKWLKWSLIAILTVIVIFAANKTVIIFDQRANGLDSETKATLEYWEINPESYLAKVRAMSTVEIVLLSLVDGFLFVGIPSLFVIGLIWTSKNGFGRYLYHVVSFIAVISIFSSWFQNGMQLVGLFPVVFLATSYAQSYSLRKARERKQNEETEKAKEALEGWKWLDLLLSEIRAD